MNIPSRTDLLDITEPITPFDWKSQALTVLQDGHLSDGRRVHVVKEHLAQQPIIMCNAIVISVHEKSSADE
jgi:hypothetical protein